MFDEENLVFILKEVGFAKSAAIIFDPALDMKSREHESIYVEAVK
jgi:hypothetical protein